MGGPCGGPLEFGASYERSTETLRPMISAFFGTAIVKLGVFGDTSDDVCVLRRVAQISGWRRCQYCVRENAGQARKTTRYGVCDLTIAVLKCCIAPALDLGSTPLRRQYKSTPTEGLRPGLGAMLVVAQSRPHPSRPA